jgi:hypothetical protein
MPLKSQFCHFYISDFESFVHIAGYNMQYAQTPARYDSEPDLLNLFHSLCGKTNSPNRSP